MTRFVSIEELSNAYCIAVANSYRLVEDGERLGREKRHVGACGCFAAAIDEIVKASAIMKATVLKPDDHAGWKLFWLRLSGKAERLSLLEREIHPDAFRNADEMLGERDVIGLLREDWVGVSFNEEDGVFRPPGAGALSARSDHEAAKRLYTYALRLYKALNIGGVPSPAAQYKIFSYLHQSGELPG